MDITDVKRLWSTPLGVVGAYSGPSGAPPVTPVAPNRCPCAVLLSTGRGVLHRTPGPRGSYCSISSRRWYLLDIVNARLHGEGLSVFSREVSMYLRQVGVVPILSCMENIELWCVGAA